MRVALSVVFVLGILLGCGGGKKTPKSVFTKSEVLANIAILKDEGKGSFQRCKAAQNLAKAPEYDEATEALMEVAKSQTNIEVRQAVIQALGDHARKRRKVVDVLIELTKDGDVRIRKVVADVLGTIDRKQVLKGLMVLLGDKEAGVRRIAIQSLTRVNLCPPAESLKPLVLDKERDIAQAAMAFVLKHIDNPDYDYSEVVVAAFGSKDGTVLQLACEAAGKGRVRKAGDHVRKLLGHNLAVVRASAARATGMLDIREAANEVAGLVYDPDKDVVVAALEALSEIGGPQQANAILAALKNDSSDSIREAAIKAVRKMKLANPKIIEALKFIQNNDPATKLRELSAETLSELGR